VAASAPDLLSEAEGRWRDALVSRDRDALEQIVHRNFRLIGTRSVGPFTLDRAEWLEAIGLREVSDIRFTIEEANRFGPVLIGTVHARWLVRYLGKEFDDCVMLTDVWVEEEGRWQAVRRHSTPLPSGECKAS
jgi:hypothetical protein